MSFASKNFGVSQLICFFLLKHFGGHKEYSKVKNKIHFNFYKYFREILLFFLSNFSLFTNGMQEIIKARSFPSEHLGDTHRL